MTRFDKAVRGMTLWERSTPDPPPGKLELFTFENNSLLEMLMNNTGDHIHKQVIDKGIIPILVKIAKKKICL
ncbi:hypothetical protein RIF29_33556 [Crotalaria pallida]|uniref:Uncharacterized protein n=1 Tax=Crotalaria pallida TaxID=3830 RepID=A0AAN9HU44_CROPI